MKRIFSLIVAAVTIMAAANAQVAFVHLGASVEAGTTGAGINFSFPVVTDHIIISAGYNFPSFTYSKSIDVGTGHVNDYIKQVQAVAPDKDLQLVNKLNATMDAKINFGNFKLMAQYYPTTESNFYFAAGVFIGKGEMITIEGKVNDDAWKKYTDAVAANNQLPAANRVQDLDRAISFYIDDFRTYQIRPQDNGRFEGKMTVSKVKPYFGIGFGSSVPMDKRVGFQMEIGAYYQGKPKFESKQEASFTDDGIDIYQKDLNDAITMIEKFSIYPQITFRITGRIF